MAITCPYCGKVAAALRIGRAATNIGVTEVCDALRLYDTVSSTAEKLGCSRAYIYKVLKAEGFSMKDIIKK